MGGVSFGTRQSLCKFLETLRGKLSLRKVASKSGLSHAYIRDLELGRNRTTNDVIKPSPDTLRKLSQAYQYPYTDLLIKAGYLEEASSSETLFKSDLDNIWYVEFGIQIDTICFCRMASWKRT